MRVNIREAKAQLTELIKRAQTGDQIVIVNRANPTARLVPAGKVLANCGKTGKGRAILDWLAANPLPDYARRSAAEEIDTAIKAERWSWP